MLNYNWCYAPDLSWYDFKSHIRQLVASSISWTTGFIAVGIIALATMGLAWAWQRIRRKTTVPPQAKNFLLRQFSIAVCIGCLLVISPLGLGWLNHELLQLLPKQFEQPAEAIVILGRGESTLSRVEEAIDLWQRESVPLIFASGHGDAPVMLELLAQRGVPQKVLDGENCSSTTEENSQFTAYILEPKGIQRIYLVSDSAHLLRAFLTFRSLGFEVVPVVAHAPIQPGHKERTVSLLADYIGIVIYALRGRFFPREPFDPLVRAAAQAQAREATVFPSPEPRWQSTGDMLQSPV